MYASQHMSVNTTCRNHDLRLCSRRSWNSEQTHHGSTIHTILHCNAAFYSGTCITKLFNRVPFQVVIAFAQLGTFDLHYLLTLWTLTNLIGLGTGAHHALAWI